MFVEACRVDSAGEKAEKPCGEKKRSQEVSMLEDAATFLTPNWLLVILMSPDLFPIFTWPNLMDLSTLTTFTWTAVI